MKVFISYSHNDQNYLDRFHTHLALLKKEHLIDLWTDHEILAGSKVEEGINDNLYSADLFIALISPDYLASNYCYDIEFKKA